MKYYLSLFLLSIILAGCTDPVRIDIKNYSGQLKFITNIEDKALDRWNSVSGKNFVNDGFMYEALDSYIITTYGDFLDKLKAIKLHTKEVQELNNLYVQAAEKQLSGFNMMKESLDNRDRDMMNNAYKTLQEGRDMEKTWASKLDSLTKAH